MNKIGFQDHGFPFTLKSCKINFKIWHMEDVSLWTLDISTASIGLYLS